MQRTHYECISKDAATKAGYQVVSGPYATRLSHHDQWLKNVLSDMEGANIVLVEVVGGIEVWRHNDEMWG